MISKIQKEIIFNDILKSLYIKGKVPFYKEFKDKVSKSLRYFKFGMPTFYPRSAARGLIINPEDIHNNFSEIKQDLDIFILDQNNRIFKEETITNILYGEIESLKQQLNTLNKDLTFFLLKEDKGGNEVFYDSFTDSTNIDLSLSTVFVDNKDGLVTLPISNKTSERINSITLVKETYSPNMKLVSGSFINCFNDFINSYWTSQVDKGEIGTYITEVNLTNKSVVPGHLNEVEINRISLDPLTTITVTVEYSTDKFNWFPLINKQISSPTSFEITPLFVLFLRFKISGTGTLGIRRIEISKVSTSSNATLINNGFISEEPLYDFDFDVESETPYGTDINYFISGSNLGPWTKILPGFVRLNESRYQTLSFGTSGSITTDTITYPSNIYKYILNGITTPIQESGILKRGLSQFKVSAFNFCWKKQGDTYHIPEISDWNNKFESPLDCYMSSQNTATVINPVPITEYKSFLMQYVNSEQEWWGVGIISTSGSLLLQQDYNYKITSYLYSDRDIVIDYAAGGLFSIGSFSTSNLKDAIGWSLLINNRKVVSDNKVYVINNVPGSGNVATSAGKSFPFSLNTGWNKVDLLIYMPKYSDLPTGILTYPLALLLRPNFFNFSLKTSDTWTYAPKIREYTLWADGRNLEMVSEFYLRWNVAPYDNYKWAWRLSSTSGTPTHVLLNYNPVANSTKTIDGKFIGSDNLFELTYTYIENPLNKIYFKAELNRQPNVFQSPKLKSYRFITIR